MGVHMQHVKASVFKFFGSLTEAQVLGQGHKEEQRLLGSPALALIRFGLDRA